MSSIKRSHNWLCAAAFAAAFWVTLRVMAATAPPPTGSSKELTAAPSVVFADEVRDPVLEVMIARFASVARASEP